MQNDVLNNHCKENYSKLDDHEKKCDQKIPDISNLDIDDCQKK